MIFTQLCLTGFGIFYNADLSDLCAGLNVIMGPNEAGKSTTLEFIRALLFGFQAGRGARKFEPLNGGAHGGWARAITAGGNEIRIDRCSGKAGGTISVTPVGQEASKTIQDLLGRADRQLFESIFAFGLKDLQPFDGSQGDSITSRIYGAGSNGFGATLLKAQDDLEARSNVLYKVGGRGQNERLRILINGRFELQKKIGDLQAGLEEYNRSLSNLKCLTTRLEEIRNQRVVAGSESVHAQNCEKAWPTWVSLVQARRDRDAALVTSFPDGGVASLDRLLADGDRLSKEVKDENATRKGTQSDLHHCQVDSGLLGARSTVREICQDAAQYESALSDLPGVSAEADQLDKDADSIVATLGPGWTKDRLGQLDTSIPQEDEVRRQAKAIQEDEMALKTAKQSAADRARDERDRNAPLERFQQALAEAFPGEPPAIADYARHIDRLDEARDLLGQMAALQDKMNDLDDRKKERVKELERLKSEAEKPQPTRLWLIAAILTLGVIIAWLLRDQIAASVTDVILFAALAAFLWRTEKRENAQVEAREQIRKDRADEIGRGIVDLTGKSAVEAGILEKHRERLKAIDQEINRCLEEIGVNRPGHDLQIAAPEGGVAGAGGQGLEEEPGEASPSESVSRWPLGSQDEVRACKQALDQARDRRTKFDQLNKDCEVLRALWDAAGKALKDAQERVFLAEESLGIRLTVWNDWVCTKGLPPGSLPETVLRIFQEVRGAIEKLEERDKRRNRVQRMRDLIDKYQAQVTDLFAQIGRPSPDIERTAQPLGVLAEEAMENQKRFERRSNLERMLQAQRTRLRELGEKSRQVNGKIAALLRQGGAQSEMDFRDRAAQFDTWQKLQQEISSLERTLEAFSSPGAGSAKLEEELASLNKESIEVRAAGCSKRVRELDEQIEQGNREVGALEARLAELEKSEELTLRLQELSDKEADLSATAEKWAALQIAQLLLKETRSRFEKDRQPDIIKRAGTFMGELTAGRYPTIVAPENLQTIKLIDRDGGNKAISDCSRGTAEQLYLAVRFAFIEHYCSQSEPLPIVMDDVLVHADGYRRLNLAAKAIAKIAKDRQVLYFTCRPVDADVLCQAAPSARRFELVDGVFTTVL